MFGYLDLGLSVVVYNALGFRILQGCVWCCVGFFGVCVCLYGLWIWVCGEILCWILEEKF